MGGIAKKSSDKTGYRKAARSFCDEIISNRGTAPAWRRGDEDLREDRPAGDVQSVAEESAERTAGELHGRAPKLFLLAHEQEVGAQLVLGEGGRGARVIVRRACARNVRIRPSWAAIISLSWTKSENFAREG